MTTFSDVIAYVTNQATREEASALFDAANARTRALRAATAAENIASLKVDTQVRLTGLKPKYLNGLTGEVRGIEAGRVKVKLDDESHRTAGRYSNPFDHSVLVPASAVVVV